MRSTSTAPAAADIGTGVRFYDHMLASLAKHALIDLRVKATGDLDVDAHHTVEDVAIVLGDALREALGDKSGHLRFGDATVPLDEALVQAVVDVAGRPYVVHTGEPEGQAAVAAIGGGVHRVADPARLGASPITPRSRCTSACCPAATRTTSWRPSSRRSPAHYAPPWRSTTASTASPARRAASPTCRSIPTS